MRIIRLCKECEEKLKDQPKKGGVKLAMEVKELCIQCRKQIPKGRI